MITPTSPDTELIEAFVRIKKRIGGQHLKRAVAAIEDKDYATAAAIALRYYDKAYAYFLEQWHPDRRTDLQFDSYEPESMARRLLDWRAAEVGLCSLNQFSMVDISAYPLTRYSHGAGCGCKIAPKVLDQILAGAGSSLIDPHLLVGNDERDDAAVYDLGDGTAVISTTDFFMPIVDDPFDFGRIAAVNAISDIYAMGGTPLLAIAILGWPIDKIPVEIAGQVIAGGRSACQEAGIPLAGGHSIDSPEPIFGLAVTGRVGVAELKKNGGASLGDLLYLTKPLGVGILSTAQKRGKLLPTHRSLAIDSMTRLNRIGTRLASLPGVHAMTDVTGFGLLGHLAEMCEASECSATIDFASVPLLDSEALHHYLAEACIPGGTGRNWDSYGHKVGPLSELQRQVLCDPQTSGGLLFALAPDAKEGLDAILLEEGITAHAIGSIAEKKGDSAVLVTVQ